VNQFLEAADVDGDRGGRERQPLALDDDRRRVDAAQGLAKDGQLLAQAAARLGLAAVAPEDADDLLARLRLARPQRQEGNNSGSAERRSGSPVPKRAPNPPRRSSSSDAIASALLTLAVAVSAILACLPPRRERARVVEPRINRLGFTRKLARGDGVFDRS
jgi:hypothetical protein